MDGATFEKRPMLHAVTDNVLLEIQKTFDFFKATVSSEQIDRIVLRRRGVACGWLQRHAARQVRCARRGFNPFSAIAWDAKKLSGARWRWRPPQQLQ